MVWKRFNIVRVEFSHFPVVGSQENYVDKCADNIYVNAAATTLRFYGIKSKRFYEKENIFTCWLPPKNVENRVFCLFDLPWTLMII